MTLRQTFRRHRVLVFAIVVLCFPLACVSGACGAHRRPVVTAEERRALENEPLPYTVSVIPWDPATAKRLGGMNPDAYARILANLLAASGAFRVSRLEAAPEPATDLIASSTGTHCNSAVVPLFTGLSLGLVPTVLEDEDCDGMVLRSAKSLVDGSVEVGVRHKGTLLLGWAAAPVGVLPGWSHGGVREDRRYAERFRLEILRNRAGIARLAGR